MSIKVITTHNNFARGQLDQSMDGRFDLATYNSGSLMFENFFSNFKGNALYSPGFENVVAFQDCALIEFEFSQNQSYIILLFANKMRFMSFDVNNKFGFVLNPSPTIFEVATPYTLAESKEIAFRKSFTQNADSMIICHDKHEPRELIRLAANDFQFRTFARKDDPFLLTFDSTKAVTGVTKAKEPTVTVTGHGYALNDRVKFAGLGGMTELNDFTAAVVEVTDVNNFKIDVDTTTFTAFTSGGTTAKALTGDFPAVCLFYKSRLYYGATRLKITTIFGSESGDFKIHTLPTTVLAESALQFTIAELTSRIEWLFEGQNSMIVGTNTLVVAVNGGAVGEAITAESIDTITTSVSPLSSVRS